MNDLKKVGFGGGCHWCTEAVFQHVEGVVKVEQGWISSTKPYDKLSEAVIVYFNDTVSLEKLIEIHLATHSSKSSHSMREKYRSAIYFFEEEIKVCANKYLDSKEDSIITKILPFVAFKASRSAITNYYSLQLIITAARNKRYS